MNALRRRATRPAFALAGFTLAMLALTACGGGSSASDASSAATTSSVPQASGDGAGQDGPGGDFRVAIEAYRSCLADNGVTLPSFGPGQGGPIGDGSGTPPSGMPFGAPPSGLPSGAPGDGQGRPGGAFLNQKPDGVDQGTWDAAIQACADVAPSFDPGQVGPGGGQPDASAVAAYRNCLTDHDATIPEGDDWPSRLDTSDATVAEAVKTCAPLLPVTSQPSPAAS